MSCGGGLFFIISFWKWKTLSLLSFRGLLDVVVEQKGRPWASLLSLCYTFWWALLPLARPRALLWSLNKNKEMNETERKRNQTKKCRETQYLLPAQCCFSLFGSMVSTHTRLLLVIYAPSASDAFYIPPSSNCRFGLQHFYSPQVSRVVPHFQLSYDASPIILLFISAAWKSSFWLAILFGVDPFFFQKKSSICKLCGIIPGRNPQRERA